MKAAELQRFLSTSARQATRNEIRELVEHYPNFTIARFHLGVIFARQGKMKAAEEQFRRVLRENPEDVAARFYVS